MRVWIRLPAAMLLQFRPILILLERRDRLGGVSLDQDRWAAVQLGPTLRATYLVASFSGLPSSSDAFGQWAAKMS